MYPNGGSPYDPYYGGRFPQPNIPPPFAQQLYGQPGYDQRYGYPPQPAYNDYHPHVPHPMDRGPSHGVDRRRGREREPIRLRYDPFSERRNDIHRVFSRRNTFPYDSAFVRKLFSGLHVVFIGDSMSRALYKDLVALLSQKDGQSELVSSDELRQKMEYQHRRDHMIAKKTEGDATAHMEVREYCTEKHLVQYFFCTRVYKEDLECFIAKMRSDPPDVLFMQSCIWDVSRYHNSAEHHIKEYAVRIGRLCRRLSEILLPTTTFVWLLLPPAEEGILNNPQRGFLSDPMVRKYAKERLNWNMRMANYIGAQVVSSFGFDVCDLVPHFDRQFFNMHREPDGVHFNPLGTRLMTQFIVAHLVDAWGVKLPVDIKRRFTRLRQQFDGRSMNYEFTSRPSKIPESQWAFFKFMNENWEVRPSASPLTQLQKPVEFLIRFLRLKQPKIPRRAKLAITDGTPNGEPNKKKKRTK